MNKSLIYFLIPVSFLFIYFAEGQVIIFASLMVIFDRCFFSRVKIFHGIEFSTIAVFLVALKYNLVISISFCIFILFVLTTAINIFLGDKWVINKEFKLIRGVFGFSLTILEVIIINYFKHIDIFLLMLIILIFGHSLYILKGKLTQTNYVLDYVGIITNILFNLFLVYFFRSFWLLLLTG